ncbi:ATP-binding protein [Vogesella sp. EB]|uniref:AAA family ATPase n=1 Tax=Vogesella sp. EB TaxID=1526735 RepID=UPI0009E46CB4|nr:ATP-binding protein [Vogesella sp. EB]
MKFLGFGFAGFRSYGNDITKVGPLNKINFIIGANNSGKSNIISFLIKNYNLLLHKCNDDLSFTRKEEVTYGHTDKCLTEESTHAKISFPIRKDDYEKIIFEKHPRINKERHINLIRAIYNSYYEFDGECIWFNHEFNIASKTMKPILNSSKDQLGFSGTEWESLWRAITNTSGGGLQQHWIPTSVEELKYTPSDYPNFILVPAIRKIGEASTTPDDYSGTGIIERLAAIQHPPLENWKDKEKFEKINKFLKTVLDKDEVSIEIPHDKSMILVGMDNKVLPLESLGTGIHEVIILAAVSTIASESIICIEEPELHLHPLLQKKLIKYLEAETDNQYLFTTHSAHLLDATNAQILHIKNNGSTSKCHLISSTKSKFELCAELGYRASDILQTNCIIWVEGPSDRIYVNSWIKNTDEKLLEGIHYSVMFYGGRLASHLSALQIDDEDRIADDLISLRSLNGNCVIIIDSDKASPRASINSTKKRLVEEFNKGPGFAWVTHGREIENYLEHEKVLSIIKETHPSARVFSENGKYENWLNYKNKSGENKTASKVKIAQKYIETHDNTSFDAELRGQLIKLVDFINNSNGQKTV